MIVPVIADNIEKIKTVCKKYGVKSLYLFGSGMSERFNTNSDIDFLVDYYKDKDGLPLTPFDYFDLLFSLEEIIGLQVDLVTADAVRNRFFKEKVDTEKVLLYAA